MGYNSIAWLPLTAGLTAIGMILSYYAYRRRGLRSALRWAAVSLLPKPFTLAQLRETVERLLRRDAMA